MNVSLNSHLYGSGTALLLNDNRDVADADLEQLVGFDHELRCKIRTVMLSRTNVTGSGIKHLSALPNLTSLFLNGSSITDAAPLGDLPRSLEVLDLDDTDVGDQGVSKLCSLPKLRILRLRRTEATDRTVLELLMAENLREVWLDDTATSWAARRRLESNMALSAAAHAPIMPYVRYHGGNLLGAVTLRARAYQPSFNYGNAAFGGQLAPLLTKG